MGISIAFRGRQPDPDVRERALAFAREHARDMEWTVESVAHESRRGLLGHRVLEMPRLDGLTLLPHFACEPVPLVFLEADGRLVDSYLGDEGGADVRLHDGPLVKTQFAGPAVHAEICQFLARLKEAFVPDLEVDDESEFFRTGDPAALEEAFTRGWDRILERAAASRNEPGEPYAIGGFQLRGAGGAAKASGIRPRDRELLDALEAWIAVRYGGFGLVFAPSVEGVENLDLLMREADEAGWASHPETSEAENFAHGAGAVFGRALEQILGGHWELDEDEGLVLENVGHVGLRVNPFQVAADRIAHGPSHAFTHHLGVYTELARRITSHDAGRRA